MAAMLREEATQGGWSAAGEMQLPSLLGSWHEIL